MRDYWLTQTTLSAIGWSYVALVSIALALALWLPKGKRGKAIAGAIVLGVASILPLKVAKETARQQVQVDEFRQRYAKAKALFDERCKTAGEKIYRRVENVDGVLLMNIRQSDRPGISDNPYWADAGLPQESAGDQYIRSFLYREYDGSAAGSVLSAGERGFLNAGVTGMRIMSRGYRYADVRKPNGEILRYRLQSHETPALVIEKLEGQPARYGIDFVNQVNPADRIHWVAGTTITLIDTRTNEVLATRESYSFEPGLGDTTGGRQPWRFAVTCPTASRYLPSAYLTRFFADQILKPSQGGVPS